MRSFAFAAALLLAGCNMHLLLQSYTVDWPQASNDVRAWGDRVMARAGHTWQRRATLDVDPARYGQPRAAALRAALIAAGVVQTVAGRLTFAPSARAASVPCGDPVERGVACRRFVVGHITNVQVMSYSYRSGNFETGPDADRTLTFRYRSVPSTRLGRVLQARRLLTCTTGSKTTPIRLGNETGTETKPVVVAWDPRVWCLGAVGDAEIQPIGPDTLL